MPLSCLLIMWHHIPSFLWTDSQVKMNSVHILPPYFTIIFKKWL
jgi:hypothetical protein